VAGVEEIVDWLTEVEQKFYNIDMGVNSGNREPHQGRQDEDLLRASDSLSWVQIIDIEEPEERPSSIIDGLRAAFDRFL